MTVAYCHDLLGEDMETFYLGVRSGFWQDTPVTCTLLPDHGGLHSAHGVVWDDREARQWHLPNMDVPIR